jgi:hypothetical protein
MRGSATVLHSHALHLQGRPAGSADSPRVQRARAQHVLDPAVPLLAHAAAWLMRGMPVDEGMPVECGATLLPAAAMHKGCQLRRCGQQTAMCSCPEKDRALWPTLAEGWEGGGTRAPQAPFALADDGCLGPQHPHAASTPQPSQPHVPTGWLTALLRAGGDIRPPNLPLSLSFWLSLRVCRGHEQRRDQRERSLGR